MTRVLSEAELAQRRTAGKARAKQFTSEYQKNARAKVKPESCVTNGRRGGLAVLQRRGREYLGQLSARHRRNHPSNLERIVMGWLKEWGYRYSREVQVADNVWVDFVLFGQIALECDHERWHTNDPLHGDDRVAKDAERERKIRVAGLHLIRLTGAGILSSEAKEPLHQQIEALTHIPF